jgi:flagellar basal body-associated protein FliL
MEAEIMAEETSPEGGDGSQGPGSASGKKKVTPILIGLGVQVVFLLIAVGLLIHAIFLQPKPKLDTKTMEKRMITSIHDDSAAIEQIDLDEIIVNLSPEHTLRAKLSVEVSNDKVATALRSRLVMIKARARQVMSSFPHEKLEKVHGKLQLKDKLIEVMIDELSNAHFEGNGTIRDVYFVDLIKM